MKEKVIEEVRIHPVSKDTSMLCGRYKEDGEELICWVEYNNEWSEEEIKEYLIKNMNCNFEHVAEHVRIELPENFFDDKE